MIIRAIAHVFLAESSDEEPAFGRSVNAIGAFR